MSIPKYQELMLPLLQLASGQIEISISEATRILSDQFDLSENERKDKLPSGRQTMISNRIGWAKTYLTESGLLVKSGHGKAQITDRGRQVLQQKPPHIDMQFLTRFPEFNAFKKRGNVEAATEFESGVEAAASQTPQEALEVGYQNLRQALAQELLDLIKQRSPKFFEQLVIDLLVAMGYGGSRNDAAQVVGQSGDEGIDGVIKEDRLGLDMVYIQAKRWDGNVGRPHIQAFAGSLEGHKAQKGIFITTSKFTAEAVAYVDRIGRRIVLMDGEQLVQLMIDYNVGVALETVYEIKYIDADYFFEDTL